MKKILFCVSLLAASNVSFAAQNSLQLMVKNIEVRLSGVNSVYVESGDGKNGVGTFIDPSLVGEALPDEGCDLTDRGIIDVSDGSPGASVLMEVARETEDSRGFRRRNVIFRVDGCALVNPGESLLTAPRIVKMIYES